MKKHKKKLRKLGKKVKKLKAYVYLAWDADAELDIKFDKLDDEVPEIKKRLGEVYDWAMAKKRAETLEWMEKNVKCPGDTQPNPDAEQLPTLPELVPQTHR